MIETQIAFILSYENYLKFEIQYERINMISKIS